MRNINTPKFWDKQFRDEYKFYKKNKELTTTCDWRWNNSKFGNIGWYIRFRGSLLDIGCGMGHFCRYIKAKNIDINVTGIDFSDYAIEKSKELRDKIGLDINFIVNDAQKLPFKDNSFEYITSLDVIEHLDNPEEHLIEIKRVLKKDGKTFILTPWKYLFNKDELMSEEHVQEWTPDEFIKLTSKYFTEGRCIIPPVLVDRFTKKVVNEYWFAVILTK